MTTRKAKKTKTADQAAVDVPDAFTEVIQSGVERQAKADDLRLAADLINAAEQDGADGDIDIDDPGMKMFDPVRIDIYGGVDDDGEEVFRIHMIGKGNADVICVDAHSHAKALTTASQLSGIFYRAELLPIRDHSRSQASPHFTGSLSRLKDTEIY